MTTNEEKRQESRLQTQETIFLELAVSSDTGKSPKVLICNTVDISANGMQVLMDDTLPMHSIHQLGIELENPEQRFHLVAEVKWCRPNADGGYLIGFALYESDDTDIEQWKQAVATRFS